MKNYVKNNLLYVEVYFPYFYSPELLVCENVFMETLRLFYLPLEEQNLRN